MGRFQRIKPPTYEQATIEYYYSPEKHALFRKYYSIEIGAKILDNELNLLELWPKTLVIDGKQWPFLKVVFLMVHKRWPRGAVRYPLGVCDPALIIET
jgi:hypothetical protein